MVCGSNRKLRYNPRMNVPSLIDRVGLGTLQQTQDRFAALGRMTVCTCNVDGEMLTRPTWGSDYSRLIGTSALGAQEFDKCVTRSILHDSDAGPVFCHEGMQLFSTPIRHDGQVLAVIVVGIRDHEPPTREEATHVAGTYSLSLDQVILEAEAINPMRGGAPEDIQRFAELLSEIISTLYGQSLRITEQLGDLRTVHELAELLAGSLDLDQILKSTVKRVVDVMAMKACAIRLLDEATGELVIRAVHNLSAEYLQKGPILLHQSRIDAAAFAGRAVYIEDARTDPRIRYPENARREGIVSGLCVPMAFRGKTIGVIRVYTDRRYAFHETEEALLRSIGSQSAAAIIHHQSLSDRMETDRVQRQMEAAGQIQRRMLPSRPPRHRGVALGCVYDPSLELGGDFYDFLRGESGSLWVCNADVMGKGLGAALLMASCRSAFRAHVPQSDTSADLTSRLNRQLFADTQAHEFLTAVCGVFSPDGRAFTYTNAGHPPPVLMREGRMYELQAGGLALGIEPEERYELETVHLQGGDTIVVVTDGVTEAMDFEGRQYGRERFLESLHRHRDLDAEQLASQIHWDVRRFAGLAAQSDDISIVVARAE